MTIIGTFIAFCIHHLNLPFLPLLLLIQVMALVFVQDVTAPAELFAHVSYFLSECSVFTLKEGGAHRDLVLLQSTSIARTLCGLIVLTTPTPILLVLQKKNKNNKKVYIRTGLQL